MTINERASTSLIPTATLEAGALNFPEIMMQTIAHIAPAVGLILTIQFMTAVSGVAAPLAFLFGFFVVLTLGISLTQLARHLPSAGGYYFYVSRTVSPKAGFLTAWMYFLYDPALTAINLAFMGYFFEATMRLEYGINCPWWIFFLVATLLITVLVYRSINFSTKIMMFFGAAEMIVVIALSVYSLLHPGSGGVNFRSYLPRNSYSISGLYLAVVFSIFSFTGFDGAAPLAEESDNPRRNMPRAIIYSILAMGLFYSLCSWALLIGWGTNDVASFNHSAENPCFVLARHFWGKWWILIFVAVLNSIIAVSISGTNAATRVLFAMSRAGVLPQSISAIHPKFHTPSNAVVAQTLITLVVGLGLGFLMGPDQEYYFMGIVTTLALVVVYGVANYGVYRFYSEEKPAEFRTRLHLVCPLVSTIAMVWVGVKSVIPFPAGYLKYAPALVGVWIVLGIVVTYGMRHSIAKWLPQAAEKVV